MNATPKSNEKWAVLVVWSDGSVEYLNKGAKVSEFTSKQRAKEMAEFMFAGMSDQVQSINVIPFPEKGN